MLRNTTRVIHLVNELRASGAETMIVAAKPYWDAAGIETVVIPTGVQLGTFSERFENAGVTVHHVPFGKRAIHFKWLSM